MKIEFIAEADIDNLTSINAAKALIEHTSIHHNSLVNKDFEHQTFEIEDLEEIAEHLLVYCKAERKRNGYDD